VTDVNVQDDFNDDDILRLAASAEQHSTHILANSLVNESKRRELKLDTPEDVSEVTGQGMTATVGTMRVMVGKPDFLKQAGVEIAAHDIKAGETVVYVAVDNKFAGEILFRDEVRPESKKVMSSLRKLGISHTLMLTGDTHATAERIAKEVGITEVRAECLPVDKVNAVRGLKTRPVMMVGDGVNDAPVLAVAEVGMAMGARGSTAASETADVVVLVDDLSKSAQAIMIAKHTITIALQSIWVGIAISIGLMLVAANGYIPAVVGAGLQEVVDVIVIFNALRAHGTFKMPKLAR
jgi:P-type E1-E2 ATPase